MQTVLFTFSTSLLLFYTEGMENDENAKHILLLNYWHCLSLLVYAAQVENSLHYSL